MKIIVEKTNERLMNTKLIVDQLPDVFTKHDYDEVRNAQAHAFAICDMKFQAPEYLGNSVIVENWVRNKKRNVAGFAFTNLIDEGFVQIVRTETFIKEIPYWKYDYDKQEFVIDTSMPSKHVECQRHYYTIRQELYDFFEEVLDN